MAELLHLFLEDATASMVALTEQIRVADVVSTGRTLHTLHGSCGQIGGYGMSQILEEMQQCLRERGLEATRELLPTLAAAFQVLCERIEESMYKVVDDPSRS